MAYNIYKSDGTPVVVPENTIDTAYYSPNANGPGKGIGTLLLGRGAIDYGSSVAQSLLQITENFCGTVFPSDTTALQGQLWFKKSSATAGELYIRKTSNTTGGLANWANIPLVDSSGNIPGNADTATKLKNSRTIASTGDATWSVNFDGSINVSSALTLASVNSNTGSFGSSTSVPQITVDAKGRITGVTTAAITASGLGAVTSVGVSVPSFLSVAGSPITSSGTIEISLSGTALPVANGGTGQTSTSGAINALLPVQTGNSGKYLTTNGSALSWGAITMNAGTVTSVGVSVPSFLSVTGSPITSSGTIAIALSGNALPVANGGTGATSLSGFLNTSSTDQTKSGALTISDATASTSKTTGALIVSGGVGIGGSLYANAILSSGDVTASASDSRLKNKLQKIDNAVSKVKEISGYTFNWDLDACEKAGIHRTTERQVGLIAQDVYRVLPEAVCPSPANNEYLTIKYEKLVALLIEAVKEQAIEIELLKSKL